MPKITISYRRSDAPSDAGRIFDRLSSRYGKDSVFMDIDTIPFGVDFRDYIDGALRGTDIVLAVIGPRWVGRRGARARIQEETDPVRIEIAAAMRMGKIIVPVLVANAVMPSPSDLPESIAKLAFLNAAEIDPGKDFHVNLDRLIRFIDALPAAASAALTSAEAAARIEPAGAIVREDARVSAEAAPPSSDSLSLYARRIRGAWWISLIRGFALFVYAVAVLPHQSNGHWLVGFSMYAVVEMTALLGMMRVVRGTRAAVWFRAETVLLFVVLLADFDFQALYHAFGPNGTRVFFTTCFSLRALAELSAGRVLARDVPGERGRVVVGALLLLTQGVVVLGAVAQWGDVTGLYAAGYAASAIALVVLASQLFRERRAAAAAANAA
jgi:TIR domain